MDPRIDREFSIRSRGGKQTLSVVLDPKATLQLRKADFQVFALGTGKL